jgi:hypothetical protein
MVEPSTATRGVVDVVAHRTPVCRASVITCESLFVLAQPSRPSARFESLVGRGRVASGREDKGKGLSGVLGHVDWANCMQF